MLTFRLATSVLTTTTATLGKATTSLLPAVTTSAFLLPHRLASTESKQPLLLTNTLNSVTTVTMNNPKKLNGWTKEMMEALFNEIQKAAKDDNTKVLVLTGKDPYYCAGVNLNSTIKPMHPKKLYETIENNNRTVFDTFIEFPKPIIVAVNGPAIGACVTSATLADAIVASEKATFSTPFAALAIVPEGCSSVHFERIMGAKNAERMLGKEGWRPTGKEAKEAGLITEVVKHEDLLPRAQALGEQYVKEGRVRNLIKNGQVEEYKAINARESTALATAFLSKEFLEAQYKFLSSKGKTKQARLFWVIKSLRPLWARLL